MKNQEISKYCPVDCSNEYQMVTEGLRIPKLRKDILYMNKNVFLTEQQIANLTKEGFQLSYNSTEADVLKIYRHLKFPDFGKSLHAVIN